MPQNPPAGVPRILARATYDDVDAAVVFLTEAFGFSEVPQARYVDDKGSITLTEMKVLDSRIMIGASGNHGLMSPRRLDACTQMLVVYVDDVEQHFAQAKQAGATIAMELNNAPWGDRRYEAVDCEGHRWGFNQHLL